MDPETQQSNPENPIGPSIIKGLASTNASIRSKTLKSLLNWIPTQTPNSISDDDLKRLWKSLFYCMWHSDKSLNQLSLINRLSTLILVLTPRLSVSYFSHFLITMRREWPGIDHLRLDKFYLLVRYFVRNMFNLMKKLNWDFVILEEFVVVLEKDLFFYVEKDGDNVGGNCAVVGLGNGVCYHVVSVFMEELKAVLPVSLDVINLLMRPFFGVFERSDNRVLVAKVKSGVFDCLVKNGKGFLEGKKSGVEIDVKDDRVLFGNVALLGGFSRKLYELGSSEGCVQSNRKVVFGLHEEFSRLEKEKESLGVEVEITVCDVDDEEVPILVPIVSEKVENDGTKKKNVKKSKKKKEKKEESDVEMVVSGDVANVEPEDEELMNEDVSEKVENEGKNKKKKKKSKKETVDRKSKKEKNEGNDVVMVVSGDVANVEQEDEELMNEDVISNLQKQFEKIAAEAGLEGDGVSAMMDSPSVRGNGKVKKRKRSKSVANTDMVGRDEEVDAAANTDGRSVKRVRFAMKNNLVWKPHSPLPPQSVRIPPSSTPRGSALKKGVSPGPIRNISQDSKKGKKKPSPLKKAKKVKSLARGGKHGKKGKTTSL